MHGLLPLPGDLVWIRRRRWRVERAARDRHVIRLDVASRDRRLTFLSPFDRVVGRIRIAAPRRVRPQHALARLARLVASADDVRIPSGAVAASADILPHQLEPAMALLAGRSRLLIADEVGLGKTVEAGIIIAELLRRNAECRMLVLVPAVLRDQWIDELSRRFYVKCLPADRANLDSIARAGAFGDNPWHRAGVWIASADFLKQRHVMDALPRDPWDLVVIDEAHTVCGDSERYELCDEIARRSRRLVLLTATPHGGDETRFRRLTQMGRIDATDEDLTVFRRTRDALGPRPPRRVRWHRITLSEPEARVMTGLRAFERVVTARSTNTDQVLLLLSVFRKRALSTMGALSQSLTRRLAWLGEPGPDAALEWAQPRLEFDTETDAVDREEREGLTAHTGLNSQQERSWLRRLRALTEDATSQESKVERLVSLIHRSMEPVVVFTEFRDSLDVIQRRLRFSRPVSILHGGQDAAERRQQLRQFLNGTTSVLVATDVAGQGLNLQSRARWVISLELPWNPTRLEQRIGRVDRISQTRTTHLTLLIARDEAESGLLVHLSRRIFAARRSFNAGTLASVAPPESDVRAALLLPGLRPSGDMSFTQDCNDGQSSNIVFARRWVRPARCAAAALVRRRALGQMWRAVDLPTGGAIRADRGRARLLVPPDRAALLLFSVPILNATGALLERRTVVLAVGASSERRWNDRALLDSLRPAIAAALKPRLAATARFVLIAERATLRRTRAIAKALREEIAVDEAQPGLFDARESRAFEAYVVDTSRLQAAIDRAGGLLEAGASRIGVHAGDPVLEIVLERRR